MTENRKPKIALMSYSMDNRKGKGTAIYTRKLIENLIADDLFELYLVHYDKVDDPLYKKAHEIIMPHLRLPFATRFVRQMLFFWKYRNHRFDIIQWCQPRLYPFFWLAPADRLVAMVFGAGDVTSGGAFPFSRRVFNFVLTHFNSRLDAVIASSEFGKEEIVEWFHVSPDRVKVIYLGGGEDLVVLDKEAARRVAKDRHGIEGNFILDVSLHTPHKNIPTLIRAYIIARGKGISQKLVIVGGNGASREEAWGIAQSSPYAADIKFIEYVAIPDLNALYSAADLFAFPSLNEGFGIPVIEAFASGTPVVTSNTTSLPEVAGDAAVVVDPLNVSELADGICRILSDRAFADSLIRKGLERARLFTWAETAARTTALYEALLERSGT